MTFPNPSGRPRLNSGDNVLARLSSPNFTSQASPLNSIQSQVDGLTSRFVEEAANPQTLAAIAAGSFAYRYARLGVLALGSESGGLLATLTRPLSVGVGLASEVTAFEGTSRGLTTLSGDSSNPNLWRLGGPGGWQQGWLSSLITFGMLKGGGYLTRESNVVFQHAFSSTAMVAGHNTASVFGLLPRAEGTLAEQLLHAEATNLQLGAGTSLVHTLAPGVHALERGLDLSLQARETATRAGSQNIFDTLSPQWATEGAEGPRETPIFDEEGNLDPNRFGLTIAMASRGKRGRQGRGGPEGVVHVRPSETDRRETLGRQIQQASQALEGEFTRFQNALESLKEASHQDPKDEGFRRRYALLLAKSEEVTRLYEAGRSFMVSESDVETQEIFRLSASAQGLKRTAEEVRRSYQKEMRKLVLEPQLQAINQQLIYEMDRYEHALETVRLKLKENRRDQKLWEMYDRLLLRHSWVARKYQIGGSCLEPGGGLDKYDIPRLEGIVTSLQRAIHESNEFYEGLDLPIVGPAPAKGTISGKTYEEILRMLRGVGLEKQLIKRLLDRIPSLKGQPNQLILSGLEGLNGLLHNRPKDERLPVVALLERFVAETTPEGSSSNNEKDTLTTSDSLRYLLIHTNLFQVGLLGRQDILGVIRESHDFYRSYPEAQGPFIELFSAKRLIDSRQAALVYPILDFARSRLDQGDKVYLEPRDSIGYGNLIVEPSSGGRSRYAVANVLSDSNTFRAFEEVGHRLVKNLIRAQERVIEGTLQHRIHIDLEQSGRDLSPERLQFWGKRLMERGPRLIINDLAEGGFMEDFRNTPPDQRNKSSLQMTQEWNRAYWEGMKIDIDQVEISYRSEDGDRKTILVNRSSPSTSQMIAALQMKVSQMKERNDPNISDQVYTLANILRDADRREDAIEVLQLKDKTGTYPTKRIRELYRVLFKDTLEEAFKGDRSFELNSQELLDLFDVFFNVKLGEDQVRDLIALPHPRYDFGRIRVTRDESALEFAFPVVAIKPYFDDSEVGEFILEITIPKNESRFIGRLERARVLPRSRGEAISVFAMERVIHLLRTLGVEELQMEAEDEGRYAWPRMGAEFVQEHEKYMYASLLRNFIDHEDIKGLPLIDPKKITTQEWVGIVSNFTPAKRDKFITTLYGLTQFRFSLKKGSPELARFRSYYDSKKKRILGRGEPN